MDNRTRRRRRIRRFCFISLLMLLLSSHSTVLDAGQDACCLDRIRSNDALLLVDHEGRVLCNKNEKKNHTPASTLKILTALTAFHYLGESYRFQTRFYLDSDQNLKIKGFGDPLLISETLKEIAHTLSEELGEVKDLILDDTYFSPDIKIPGRGHSTNPYDAPVGALCANFNTVFFATTPDGRLVSAEPQTPLIPYAKNKIRFLNRSNGRYTFTHDEKETTIYAGKLFSHFLVETGVEMSGQTRLGDVTPGDRLILTYCSKFTLSEAVQKMMEFSNNFMANQILIALGAYVFGPPGTLDKGVKALNLYALNQLGLNTITVVEGSGISRENSLSALDMWTVLKHFRPYRHLLSKENNLLFKTGSLRGIRNRAGFIEGPARKLYYFVIFLNHSDSNIGAVMECVRQAAE